MKWAPWKLPALFYLGLLFFVVFEILKVYFIMPFPGSQESNTLSIGYFLHQWRIAFRVAFGLMLALGFIAVMKKKRKWISFAILILGLFIISVINLKMQADKMFKQPKQLIMSSSADNKVDSNSLVVGIEINGEAKAYPIKFIAYHHIVYDQIGGESVIITYCSVCHSGRIFSHNGEKFRLVGMDHFNAMFEDQKTGSWWRQATGECVVGKRKGEKWIEKKAIQMTIEEWFALFPQGKVMQADPTALAKYDMSGKFEQGTETGSLERTDSVAWKDKSLVIGITIGSAAKAYDWRELLMKKVINDSLAGQKIVLVAYPDKKSFASYLNFTGNNFELVGDTLKAGDARYDLYGRSFEKEKPSLQRIYAYQEFWHSWKFFHPATLTYNK